MNRKVRMRRILLGMIFALAMLATACQARKEGSLMPQGTLNLGEKMAKMMEWVIAWREKEAIKEMKVEILLNLNANRVDLVESEWLKYHSRNVLAFNGYAYYEDILILDDTEVSEIYRREEGRWKKAGTLEDYLGLERIYSYLQFKQYLLVEHVDQLWLVDMENWTYRTLVTGVWADYYIHEGKLLYASEDGVIMQLELPEGKPEEFEAYRESGITEGLIRHFAIREDGTMVVVKRIPGRGTEFWLWKKNKEGQWREKKLTDLPDDWEYSYTFDYNQRGFIVLADPYNWIEEEERTTNTGYGAIQESGEIQEVYIPDYWTILPIDDSYFMMERVERTAGETPTVVLRYDYEGNKIAEYVLCEQEIIELGFRFRHIIYEDNKLTGFYEHELTGELYIVQIDVEPQGISVWNEEAGNSEWYPTEKSWLDSAGFAGTEPYYEYTNPETGVQAVLYYNEALERGCVIISEDGRTPLYAFVEAEDKLWEGARDYDRFAALGEVGGETGQDMVDRDFQEHYEYDEEGRTIYYSSMGIVEWFSGEPEEWDVLEISWEYDDRGKLRKYTYSHNPNIFGTWYQWLTSWLDEWERTEYERYYVTHGVHTSFYIYSDDSSNPKYHLLICPGCGSYKLSRLDSEEMEETCEN